MDQSDQAPSLDDLRAEAGSHEEWQELAVMDGIVCQLTGTGQWAAQAQSTADPAKNPFDD